MKFIAFGTFLCFGLFELSIYKKLKYGEDLYISVGAFIASAFSLIFMP